jgi:hypothetical protein
MYSQECRWLCELIQLLAGVWEFPTIIDVPYLKKIERESILFHGLVISIIFHFFSFSLWGPSHQCFFCRNFLFHPKEDLEKVTIIPYLEDLAKSGNRPDMKYKSLIIVLYFLANH